MKSLVAFLLLTLSLPAMAQEPPCTCTCQCQLTKPPDPVPPAVTKMKFHPGHYMTLDKILTSPEIRAEHLRQIDAIKAEPAIRGIKLFLYWGAIEKAQGDYTAGFAILDEYLARLKATDKYLILSVQDRIFGGYDPAKIADYLPAYVLSAYGKTEGVWQSGRITMPRMWQQGPMDRYIAMLKAIAAKYDAHPNLEMVQTEETSVSIPVGTDGYTLASYGAQVKRLLTEIRPAYKQTQLRLSTNFYGSDEQMLELLKFCDLLDIAVGGPDIIPNQTIQANRLYDANFKGKMIWVSEVQAPSLGGKEGTFTAQQIYESGMQQQPNYFLWYRNTWSGGTAQKWDTGLLPYIRQVQGKVVSTCPANVEGCRAQ